LCKVLSVSRSGYYDWKGRAPSRRAWQDAALSERISEIHQRSRQTYGSPRVHAELGALGIRCGRKRVERLMRRAGLKGCVRGRRRATTRRGTRSSAKDLLNRDFVATRVDKVWVADITYVATAEGLLYVAFILDVYSRKVVGWAMEPHLRTELVVDALRMAVWRRKPAAGLAHHSDQGSAVHGALFLGKAEGGRHHPFDVKDRNSARQRHGRVVCLYPKGGADQPP
jgi:putative transposase